MKRAIPQIAICACTVLFVAGCSKTDSPQPPKAAQQLPSEQGAVAPPSSTPPPMPEPIVPKGAEARSPLPGQAGDTSSEAFKDGGRPDPHK